MRVYLGTIALVAACGAPEQSVDPGRVTLHRLNNAEYNNTIHDLTGTGLSPANDFPVDDRAFGFDTIADALRLSTLTAELYQNAAVNVLNDVLAVNIPPTLKHIELVGDSQTGNAQNGGWFFFSNGNAPVVFTAAGNGRYHLTFRAYQTPAGPDPAQILVEVPGMLPISIPVTALQAAPAIYSADVNFTAGTQSFTVGFGNDFYDQATSADRNLWIDYVEIEGPFDGASVDEQRRARIFTCANLTDAQCQDDIVRGFAKRAWRRPPHEDEISRLLALVADATAHGDSAEVGLRNALQAILVSPHFLYRVEIDPSPADKTPHPLTDYELATRLSYFLWSSMPDDELMATADAGTLGTPAELERQIRRMLDDPKAIALVDNFAGQWLFTRALGAGTDPDYALFPDYDDALEAAMREETRRYVLAFLQEDIPMTEFLTADFTYANDRLAAFYGLPMPGSNEAVKVSLEGTPRRGFLTQASFLRVTSNPKRTSPVRRGKWILDNLLCAPPPPPPPGVEGVPEKIDAGSLRERLEAHRSNPVCASCHSTMDPMGFALENFDAIGKYRTMDGTYMIDSTGGIFGSSFTDATGLAKILAAQPNTYRCMVEKLYAYSGRIPIKIDAIEHVEQLTRAFEDSGYSLRELIVAMAMHPSFTSRRGEP